MQTRELCCGVSRLVVDSYGLLFYRRHDSHQAWISRIFGCLQGRYFPPRPEDQNHGGAAIDDAIIVSFLPAIHRTRQGHLAIFHSSLTEHEGYLVRSFALWQPLLIGNVGFL